MLLLLVLFKFFFSFAFLTFFHSSQTFYFIVEPCWMVNDVAVYIIHPCTLYMQTSKYRAITFWHYFYVLFFVFYFFFLYSIRLNLDNITLPFALNELCGMHWLACFTSYINPLLLFSIFIVLFNSFRVRIYLIYCIYYIVVKTMTWTRVPVETL